MTETITPLQQFIPGQSEVRQEPITTLEEFIEELYARDPAAELYDNLEIVLGDEEADSVGLNYHLSEISTALDQIDHNKIEPGHIDALGKMLAKIDGTEELPVYHFKNDAIDGEQKSENSVIVPVDAEIVRAIKEKSRQYLPSGEDTDNSEEPVLLTEPLSDTKKRIWNITASTGLASGWQEIVRKQAIEEGKVQPDIQFDALAESILEQDEKLRLARESADKSVYVPEVETSAVESNPAAIEIESEDAASHPALATEPEYTPIVQPVDTETVEPVKTVDVIEQEAPQETLKEIDAWTEPVLEPTTNTFDVIETSQNDDLKPEKPLAGKHRGKRSIYLDGPKQSAPGAGKHKVGVLTTEDYKGNIRDLKPKARDELLSGIRKQLNTDSEAINDISAKGMRARTRRIMQRAKAAFDAPIYGRQNDDLDKIAEVSKETVKRAGRAAKAAGKVASEATLKLAVTGTLAANRALNSYDGEYSPGYARRRLILCAVGSIGLVSAGVALKYGSELIPHTDTLDIIIPKHPHGHIGGSRAAKAFEHYTTMKGDTFEGLERKLHPDASVSKIKRLTQLAMHASGYTPKMAHNLQVGEDILLK